MTRHNAEPRLIRRGNATPKRLISWSPFSHSVEVNSQLVEEPIDGVERESRDELRHFSVAEASPHAPITGGGSAATRNRVGLPGIAEAPRPPSSAGDWGTTARPTRVAMKAGEDLSLSYPERGICNKDREATCSRSERPLPEAPGPGPDEAVFKTVGVAMQDWTIAPAGRAGTRSR